MRLGKLLASVFSLLLFAAIGFAQSPDMSLQEGPQRDQERLREGHRHPGMRPHLGFRGMRQLDLTEEQRQQQRAILQRHLGATKAQREELFKLREKRIAGTFTADDEARAQALREEIQSSMRGIRSEMEGVLTAEQRAKLEQLKSERKARREDRRERRRDFQRSDSTR
jgi:Spy/CpxP family protein refolding chaperone